MRSLLLVALVSSTAWAEPVTLRLASAVPEGTAWAREGKAFARDVEQLTHGEVRVKWYLGGIAGDETQVLDRMRRDQLDGVGSGGPICTRLAPSLRVTRLVGLLHSRDEAAFVVGKLKPVLDEEFNQSGYVNLWEAGLGPSILFTRHAVRDMEALRKERYWTWDLDELFAAGLRAVGVGLVPLPLHEAARAYDEGRSDGFITMPVAALAFQWSAQARYVSNLPTGFLTGCLVVAHRTFDALPVESQRAILDAAAKFQARMEDVGRQQDAALLDGGLLARQGLEYVPISTAFRASFYAAAAAVREHDATVSAALRDQVDGWLKQYRQAHP